MLQNRVAGRCRKRPWRASDDSGEGGTLRRVVLFASAALCALAAAPTLAVAAPIATTEAAIAVSYEQAILEGTVNPEGSATSYWFEYGETTAYGTKVPVIPESVGSGTSGVRVSTPITGLNQSTIYHFRIVAESGGESVMGADTAFTTAGFNFSFGEGGSGNGQFSEPFGLAVDSKGNIWVSDTGNNRVEEFNEKGEYVSQFGKEGAGNGEFKAPKGIAIDSSGNIWIVDSGNDRVQKFNSEGKYLGKFGEEGSGEGQFESPSGIALNNINQPFVVDTGNDRVEKFSATFSFLFQLGKEGTGDGEFKSPTGIVVEPGHRIWVTDAGNDRVQRFNGENYVSKFGNEGTGNGEFNGPTGIVSDFQERLWVVDSGNNRAQKFDIESNYLDQAGEKGAGSGQFVNPMAIVAPAAQKLLILDSGNDRVESWTVKADPPRSTSNPADNVKTTSATLHANLNPRALATIYWFEYGTTEAYGFRAPLTPESIGSGLTNVLVEQGITGLSEGTKYHYRAVAESAAGVSFSNDLTFITVQPPVVTTEAATAIGSTQATLNGTVNPERGETVYWFEYGTTEAYGTKIPIAPKSVGSVAGKVAVSQTPIGLSRGTEYHFRLVAENEAATVEGSDKAFTTSP